MLYGAEISLEASNRRKDRTIVVDIIVSGVTILFVFGLGFLYGMQTGMKLKTPSYNPENKKSRAGEHDLDL